MGSTTEKWRITQITMASNMELQRLIPSWRKMGRPRLYVEMGARGWKWDASANAWLHPEVRNSETKSLMARVATDKLSKPDKISLRLIVRADRAVQAVADFVELAECLNYTLVRRSGEYDATDSGTYVRVYLEFTRLL